MLGLEQMICLAVSISQNITYLHLFPVVNISFCKIPEFITAYDNSQNTMVQGISGPDKKEEKQIIIQTASISSCVAIKKIEDKHKSCHKHIQLNA